MKVIDFLKQLDAGALVEEMFPEFVEDGEGGVRIDSNYDSKQLGAEMAF